MSGAAANPMQMSESIAKTLRVDVSESTCRGACLELLGSSFDLHSSVWSKLLVLLSRRAWLSSHGAGGGGAGGTLWLCVGLDGHATSRSSTNCKTIV